MAKNKITCRNCNYFGVPISRTTYDGFTLALLLLPLIILAFILNAIIGIFGPITIVFFVLFKLIRSKRTIKTCQKCGSSELGIQLNPHLRTESIHNISRVPRKAGSSWNISGSPVYNDPFDSKGNCSHTECDTRIIDRCSSCGGAITRHICRMCGKEWDNRNSHICT